MQSNEIRQRYLKFFEKRGHKIIPSASLVPENDASVLFTTAGMQQFKRYYLFPDEASSARITTVQKCVRTGDIDEVGDDTHLTFFEMLGNFSFGYPKKEHSYFKKEAIGYAWEFLTEVLGIDTKRITATFFKGEDNISRDDESYELLKEITNLPEDKIKGTGIKETFWSLGTEGSPGGPTVEFYIDGIEVWNIVFNQYVMKDGKFIESEFKGVDTGMGFERLVTVMQGKKSVYETDIFEPIIKAMEKDMGEASYERSDDESKKKIRILVDHIRSAVFIIAEGIIPGKNERSYVLRRLLRRLFMFADMFFATSLFSEVISAIIVEYKDQYKELDKNKEFIEETIWKEEQEFRKTMIRGRRKFELSYKKDKERKLSGLIIFKLVTEDGFPIELIRELAKIEDIELDEDNFLNLMEEHKKISKAGSEQKFKGGLAGTGEMEIKYHTATHLLLASLRKVLGEEITQKGSNITAERMRFDFNWPEKVTLEKTKKVEDLVNQKIAEKIPVEMLELPKEEAKKIVTTLSFDLSKYGDVVKVYKIGDFSAEFCGGPHVKNTNELGTFKIVKEEASSSGVRRIKAILE